MVRPIPVGAACSRTIWLIEECAVINRTCRTIWSAGKRAATSHTYDIAETKSTMQLNANPYNWLSPAHRKRAFFLLLALTLVLMAWLRVLDRPLQTPAAPQGIVSFELAGTLANAQAILDSWDAEAQVYASLSLGVDYLFMVAYASAIGLGCVLIGRSLSPRRKRLGALGGLLAWGLIAAGLLDALENFALIQTLLGSTEAMWPPVARWSATGKFLLIALGLIYALIAGGVAFFSGRVSTKEEG